jgi:ABC-2 type transport system permease protein
MRLIKNELSKEINIFKLLIIITVLIIVSFAVIKYNYRGHDTFGYRDGLSYVNNQLANAEATYYQDHSFNNLKKLYIAQYDLEVETIASNKHILNDSWEDFALDLLSVNHENLTVLKMLSDGVDPTSFSGGEQYANINFESEYLVELEDRKKVLDIVEHKQYYDYLAYEIDNLKKDNDRITKLIDDGDENYLELGQKDIDYNNEVIKIKQFLIDKKVTSNKDARAIDANELINIANTKHMGELDIVSEDDFNLNYDLRTTFHNYANYKQVNNEQKEKVRENELKTWYAMKHNIQLTNTTKEMVNHFFSLFIFVTLGIIILFGGIIAKEYQTGTIKLLLIRGIRRSKIIIAKYITVIMSTYALILLFLIIYLGITMFYMNYNDLLVPEVIMFNGHAMQINYFVYILIECFIASLPCLFFITLTLLLSAIIINIIVTTSIGVFLATCSLMFSYIIVMLYFKFNLSFLKYTPLPYLDINPWLGNNNDQYLNNLIYNFDINRGILILILSIIIMYVATHITFVKRDVRS